MAPYKTSNLYYMAEKMLGDNKLPSIFLFFGNTFTVSSLIKIRKYLQKNILGTENPCCKLWRKLFYYLKNMTVKVPDQILQNHVSGR